MAGIYIHIPYCKQACHYCDFHFSTKLVSIQDMVKAIGVELSVRKNELQGSHIKSIYFGGGTPSLLSVKQLAEIMETIHKNYQVVQDAEITLEANPDDLNKEYLGELKLVGVNRLSVGVQSFFDKDLQYMNRSHNANQSKSALQNALEIFDNISIDLIYGVPTSDDGQWSANLSMTMDFGIPHISAYALTVEPNTALHHMIRSNKTLPVQDEHAQKQFAFMTDYLTAKGFEHYEVSNFCRDGLYAVHNRSYWQGGHYLGVGPSAHSYNGKQRTWNLKNNHQYIRKVNEGGDFGEHEWLTKIDRFNEMLMVSLRTQWGLSMQKVAEEFGPKYLEHLRKRAQKFQDQGLLHFKNNALVVGNKGKFLLDGITADLFMEQD